MIQRRLLDYACAPPADSQGAHGKLSNRGASAGNGLLNQWVSGALYVIPWIVPALMSLYIKHYLLTEARGFVFAARYFGRAPIEHGQEPDWQSYPLTHLEKLSFFRMDILVGFLLVPLLLIALARYLPRRWRFPTTAFLSLGISTALYVQFRALTEIGRYMSFRMLWTALSWGWHEPRANASYLKGKSLLLLLAGVFFIASVLWLGTRRHTALARTAEQRWRIPGSMALACLFLLLLLALVLSWLPRLPRTSYHASVLLGALNAFWLEGDVETKEFAGLSIPELLSRYRELTHAPPSQRNPHYWGKAKGCNVLFIVLETAPASFLPAEDKLDDFPNLRRLQSKSFVGKLHYTTYPHTHEAFFSLFSSWYPSALMKSFERQHPDMVVPGIMHILSSLGYHTATYAPATWGGELDPEMFQELGFQQEVFPHSLAGGYDLSDWKGMRVGRDVAALNLMKEDLEHWLTNGDKFAAVFLPQIGHAPWPDDSQSGGENDIRKRGRAILARQDAWLGELLQLLERRRQLQQTLIVIVGDHGIRMRYEDPSNALGTTIDEYGFHVPLTIYAPQALEKTEMISWATSHIDVAPTLLDLLGIEQGRDFEQGTAIWNPDLVNRTTYFFALHTLGADGYYSNGHFYMWSHNSDLVGANVRMHFDPNDFVPRDSPTYLEVTRSIARMAGLQQVWATQFGQKESLRNHLYSSSTVH
jgi:phosphoglycerol transferase MdoB-like AlkP superfamily enzyme